MPEWLFGYLWTVVALYLYLRWIGPKYYEGRDWTNADSLRSVFAAFTIVLGVLGVFIYTLGVLEDSEWWNRPAKW